MSIWLPGNKEAKSLYVKHNGAVKEALSAYINKDGEVVKVFDKGGSDTYKSNVWYIGVNLNNFSVKNKSQMGNDNPFIQFRLYVDNIESIELTGDFPHYQNLAYDGEYICAVKDTSDVDATSVSTYFNQTGVRQYWELPLSGTTQYTMQLTDEHISKFNLGATSPISFSMRGAKGVDFWCILGFKVTTKESDNHLKFSTYLLGESFDTSSKYSRNCISVFNESDIIKISNTSSNNTVLSGASLSGYSSIYNVAMKGNKTLGETLIVNRADMQQDKTLFSDYDLNLKDNSYDGLLTQLWIYHRYNDTDGVSGYASSSALVDLTPV